MFMGFEIDNNNGANCYRATAVFPPPAFGTFGTLQPLQVNDGANCYRATAVFPPPAFGTFGTLQPLQVNERRNSEITCDILIPFSIETVLSNS